MPEELIEAGKIVNTHGVNGAVKIEPWTDTPEFLRSFSRLFIGGKEYKVLSTSILKNFVIAMLDGVENIDAAHALRNKIVKFARAEAPLDEGEVFVRDLIGLDAIDAATGEPFGKIAEFLSLPSNGVYVIKSTDGSQEKLIAAVPEFVQEINIPAGQVIFKLIDGM